MRSILNSQYESLYTAAKIVGRELAGLILASSANMNANAATLNQTVRFPLVNSGDLIDLTPSMSPPDQGDQTVQFADIVITNAKAYPVKMSGFEERGVSQELTDIRTQQYAQAMRKLVNDIEDKLALEGVLATIAAGKFYGTPGTTVFGTSLADMAQVKKVLDDAGAPQSDRQLVVNTTAGAALRANYHLTDVSRAGSDQTLRQGVLLPLMGFDVRESAGLKPHTNGTGAGYLVNGAVAAGESEITVDTGTGTFNKGDLVKFAGDDTLYAITQDETPAATSIKIAPALKADVADNAAITIQDAYQPNLAFPSSALVLATRVPDIPVGGDNAIDATTITDPVTGLTFMVRVYGGHLQNVTEVMLMSGFKCTNPELACALIG